MRDYATPEQSAIISCGAKRATGELDGCECGKHSPPAMRTTDGLGLTTAHVTVASLAIACELLELAAAEWDDLASMDHRDTYMVRADQARQSVASLQRAIARAEATVPANTDAQLYAVLRRYDETSS